MKGAFVAATTAIVCLSILGGFMALDKTVGHWYVPETAPMPLTTDEIAQAFLGEWDRSVPLEGPELTRTLSEPPPGSTAQLQAALDNFANLGSVVLLTDEVRGLSDQATANRFQECEAFLMGRNANGSSCNIVALGQ